MWWMPGFEWEREWRVPGGLRWELPEAAFLFAPEVQHVGFRSFFYSVERSIEGPFYRCPLVDATWPEDRLRAAFAGVS